MTKFIDKMKSGKEYPWKEKKLRSVEYASLLSLLKFESKYKRVIDCAAFMQFKKHIETGEQRLYKTFFCKSRLCPLCNSRRSLKHYYQSAAVVSDVVKKQPNARWLLLTLTVKNVFNGKQLDQSLREMSIGFNRLIKYVKVSKNLIGFMRATEVTVNPNDGSYNQHMHVLLCVESTYFLNTKNYIAKKEWSRLWGRAMKLDYLPIVDIQIIRSNSGGLKEVAKYPVKDTDYLTRSLDKNLKRVADLEEGLFRKRLISYGGLLKESHKILNLDDVDDGDLIHVDEENKEIKEEELWQIINVFWDNYENDYFIK